MTDVLNEVLSDPALQKKVEYIVFCFLGQAAVAFWLWLSKDIDKIVDRFLHDRRATAKAFLWNMGIIISAVAILDLSMTPWLTVAWLGLQQGIGVDSKVNRSAREVWTEEERKENVVQPTGKEVI